MRNHLICAAAALAVVVVVPQGARAQLITGSDSITQSSDIGFPASNALDRNFGNFTHTAGGGADANPTLTYDLPGGDYALDEFVIFNRGDGCCQSRLRDITVVVRDAANTTDLFTSPLLNPENALGGGGTGGPDSLSVDLTGITGGIILVRRTPDPDLSGTGGQGNADEGWVLSVGEIEAYGTPVPEPTAAGLLAVGAGVLLRRRRRGH